MSLHLMNSKDEETSIRTYNAFKERLTLLASCSKPINEELGNSCNLMLSVRQRRKRAINDMSKIKMTSTDIIAGKRSRTPFEGETPQFLLQ